MPSQWTGEIVGKMHEYGILKKELAEKLGYNPKYVSAVLNGKREPKNAQDFFTRALVELIDAKKSPAVKL